MSEAETWFKHLEKETDKMQSKHDTDVKMVDWGTIEAEASKLQAEAEKPGNERRKLLIGRQGSRRIPRKYHLTEEEMKRLSQANEATGGAIINPYVRRGLYYGQVQALIELGADEWHSFKTIREKVQEILEDHEIKDVRRGIRTNAWKKALYRGRNPENMNPADINTKMIRNFQILQRIVRPGHKENNPYGEKLAQLGLCIDVEWKAPHGVPVPFYRLRTGFDRMTSSPLSINPFKKRPGRKKKVQQTQDQ